MGGWFGGNPTARGSRHEIVEAQRRGVLDQHPEDAAAARELADRRPVRLPDPEGDEALQLVAAPVDHAERRVARPRQLGGDPDQRLQDGVERQLRGDRDSGLDEPPPPLIAVHTAIQPCWPRSRIAAAGRLHRDAARPEAADRKERQKSQPHHCTRGRSRRGGRAHRRQRPALGWRRRRQRRDDGGRPRPPGRRARPAAPRTRRSRSWPGSRRTARCSGNPARRCGCCSSRISSARSASATPTTRSPRSSTSTCARAGSRSTSAGSRSSAPTR